MADVIRMEEVRRAAEKLCRMLQNVDINRKLCTSDIIALSFWLIDHENVTKLQPVKRVAELLTKCLEQQVIRTREYHEIVVTCTRCTVTPILKRKTDPAAKSTEYQMQ